MTAWKDAPTKSVDVNDVRFVYRELGRTDGVPVVFLHHFTATLDDWDPRVLDGIATRHRVITFDNRGVGGTGSTVPSTIDAMGADAIAFIRALGFEQVDLFVFSLGGGVAQMVALQAPHLVRRIVLAGTGPRGGGGIDKMTRVVGIAYLKAALTRQDPRNFPFFPRTPDGKRAAKAYFDRLAERTTDRDTKISLQARVAQLRAIVARRQERTRRSLDHHPTGLRGQRRPRSDGGQRAFGRHDPAPAFRERHDLSRLRSRRRLPAPPHLRAAGPGVPRRPCFGLTPRAPHTREEFC